MSFWTHVLHFLRQTQLIEKVGVYVKRLGISNLTFLVLLVAFPFFQVLKHSTLCLLPICLFLLILFLKSLFQEPKPKLDFADFLVLLILLLQVSSAFVGYGRAVDALSAALLTSVWFPARRFFEGENAKRLVFFSSLPSGIVCVEPQYSHSIIFSSAVMFKSPPHILHFNIAIVIFHSHFACYIVNRSN